MASNNDSSKPDQNASKRSASDDFADVDWMIMSDLSTKIGGDSLPKQKQNQQSTSSSKSSENKFIDDDDEDLQWLQSLGLDEPVAPAKSLGQQTSLINQQSSNQKAEDVGDIDWLIVTDLKAKTSTAGKFSSVEIAPANNFLDDELGENSGDDLGDDLGLESLSGLSFSKNADLSDLDTLGFSNSEDDFSTDAIAGLDELDSKAFNLGLDDLALESDEDNLDINEWEQAANFSQEDLSLSNDSNLDLDLDLDQSGNEFLGSSFGEDSSWSADIGSEPLDLPENFQPSLDEFTDVNPELEANYQDYYDNADVMDFDSNPIVDDFSQSQDINENADLQDFNDQVEALDPFSAADPFGTPIEDFTYQPNDFVDDFAIASIDSSMDAVDAFEDLQNSPQDSFEPFTDDFNNVSVVPSEDFGTEDIDHFAHDSFGQVQDLANSGIDVSSDAIWASSEEIPAIALDSFENNVDDVFENSWESTANSSATNQAIDDSIWHSDEVANQSNLIDADMSANIAEFGSTEFGSTEFGSTELEIAVTTELPNPVDHSVEEVAQQFGDDSWQDELENELEGIIGNEDIAVENFDSADDLSPAWQVAAESILEKSDLEDLSTVEDPLAIAINADESDWNSSLSINEVNEINESDPFSDALIDTNLTDLDASWNTNPEAVMDSDEFASSEYASYIDPNFSQPSAQDQPAEDEDEFEALTTIGSKFASSFTSHNVPNNIVTDLPAPEPEIARPEIASQFSEAAPIPPDLTRGIVLPPPPFPTTNSTDNFSSNFRDQSSTPYLVPPPSDLGKSDLDKSSGLGMDGGDSDFLDDFDLDSIDTDITGDDFSSGFLPPSVATTLNPPSPPKPEPTIPTVSSPPPPPFLPPLPPKRPASPNKGVMPPHPTPNPLPRHSPLAEEDGFEQFHSQPSQGRQPRGIDSVDKSWSELLDADTVLSGVLKSPATPPRSDTAGRPYTPNSTGRSLRDNSSSRDSRGSSAKKKTTELSDFNDLGIDIHDDNTDWSGLLDSVDLSDSLTSISESSTQLPSSVRNSPSNFAKDRTSVSETREIPRDRRPSSGFNIPQNQAPMPSPVVDFNRFTDDSYNGYGGGYEPEPVAPSKPKMTMPSISIESLWQDYLKLPVIGLGAIGGLFLLYSVVNRPVFDLGLRWGIFKDARGKDFSKADLRGAKLDNVDFSDAILTGAKMQDTSLVGANLQGANLNGTNFTNANMSRARLVQASVVWSEFTNAQMNLVDFAGADLTRSNFSGAKMDGANLKGAKIGAQGTDKATKFSPITLLAWQIVNTPREGRNLSSQDLSGLNLSSSNLRRANLTNTKLNYTDMSQTDLSGGNLKGSQVNGINWNGAKLSGANLTGINFDKSKAPKTNEETICPNNRPGPCKF